MGECSSFYAHTPVNGGDWHDLTSHLEQTAAKALRVRPRALQEPQAPRRRPQELPRRMSPCATTTR
jgi:hypothetical protein